MKRRTSSPFEVDQGGEPRSAFGRPRPAYVLLTVGLLVVIFPFLWTMLASFKPEGEIRQNPPTLLAGRMDHEQLHRPVRADEHGHRVPQQRDHRHRPGGGEPAVVLDGRLRLR